MKGEEVELALTAAATCVRSPKKRTLKERKRKKKGQGESGEEGLREEREKNKKRRKEEKQEARRGEERSLASGWRAVGGAPRVSGCVQLGVTGCECGREYWGKGRKTEEQK